MRNFQYELTISVNQSTVHVKYNSHAVIFFLYISISFKLVNFLCCIVVLDDALSKIIFVICIFIWHLINFS